jgi:deoxyadenosine/deoxycytidine kinase
MEDDSDNSSEESNCISIGALMNSLYTQECESSVNENTESSENENTESSENENTDLSVSDISFRPRIVSVEGNIGGGKSTLIEKLQEKYINDRRFHFLLEPVDQWEKIRDKNGKNMLQKYYDNPTRYAFAFQIMAFQTRLQLLKDTLEYIDDEVTTIVMERSLDADYQIFAKMLAEEGLMEDVEFEIYKGMSAEALKEYGVDGIIWLDTDYEECFRRVQKRSREGEENGKIALAYLRKCHEYHIEWLGADTGFVCRVDGTGTDIDLEKIDNYLD